MQERWKTITAKSRLRNPHVLFITNKGPDFSGPFINAKTSLKEAMATKQEQHGTYPRSCPQKQVASALYKKSLYRL